MKINVQAVNFTIKESLVEYFNEKIEKVTKIYDKIISVKVFFKLGNSSEKENKQIELILQVPGEEIIIKKEGQSFEECVDLSIDSAKKIVIKHKEK